MTLKLPRLPLYWRDQPQLFERYWDDVLRNLEQNVTKTDGIVVDLDQVNTSINSLNSSVSSLALSVADVTARVGVLESRTSVLISSQPAGTVFAAPSGASGPPSFRAIAVSDVPTLNQNTTGNAATATALQTARNINGVPFDGTAPITVTANTPNALTFNNSGAGGASGSTFNGSVNVTVSYNTIGAPKADGTGASGTWPIAITGQANNVANAITFNNGGAGIASGGTFNGGSAVTVSYNTIGAPKADGTGASGTWGISVTGNAATATTANGLNASNYYAVQRMDFSGDNSNATINVATPNNGTTGGIRLLGNATSGKAYQQITNSAITVQWGYWEYDSTGKALWSGPLRVNGSTVPTFGTAGLSVASGNIANPQKTTINNSTTTTIAQGAGMLLVIRNITHGGTCVVAYENAQTPVIIANTGGGTTFQTTAPSGSAQIQLTNKSGNLGVDALASADRNGAVLSVAVLQSD